MTTKRMKSDQVRVNWADVLQHVRQGGTVIVEHYNRPVATIAPYEETAVTATDITVTLARPIDATGWNWAEVATDQWITAAEKAGLVVELVSEEVAHVDSEAAIVSVGTTNYVLDVHGDEVRAVPADEA